MYSIVCAKMTGRIIYVIVLILMLSHKVSAGGCRNVNPCEHRPKRTTPKVVIETIKPIDVTTVIYNVDYSTPSIVNEGSTKQVSQEDLTTTSTILVLSTTMAPTNTVEPSTTMEASTRTDPSSTMEASSITELSTTMEPSTVTEPFTTIEPSTVTEPSTRTGESGENNIVCTGNEDPTSPSPITEVFSTIETQSISEASYKSSTESDSEEVHGKEGGPIAKCPDTNGLKSVFIADCKDCSVFYMCNWGKFNKMKCPSGLHFNSKLNVCDWPEAADCKNRS